MFGVFKTTVLIFSLLCLMLMTSCDGADSASRSNVLSLDSAEGSSYEGGDMASGNEEVSEESLMDLQKELAERVAVDRYQSTGDSAKVTETKKEICELEKKIAELKGDKTGSTLEEDCRKLLGITGVANRANKVIKEASKILVTKATIKMYKKIKGKHCYYTGGIYVDKAADPKKYVKSGKWSSRLGAAIAFWGLNRPKDLVVPSYPTTRKNGLGSFNKEFLPGGAGLAFIDNEIRLRRACFDKTVDRDYFHAAATTGILFGKSSYHTTRRFEDVVTAIRVYLRLDGGGVSERAGNFFKEDFKCTKKSSSGGKEIYECVNE